MKNRTCYHGEDVATKATGFRHRKESSTLWSHCGERTPERRKEHLRAGAARGKKSARLPQRSRDRNNEAGNPERAAGRGLETQIASKGHKHLFQPSGKSILHGSARRSGMQPLQPVLQLTPVFRQEELQLVGRRQGARIRLVLPRRSIEGAYSVIRNTICFLLSKASGSVWMVKESSVWRAFLQQQQNHCGAERVTSQHRRRIAGRGHSKQCWLQVGEPLRDNNRVSRKKHTAWQEGERQPAEKHGCRHDLGRHRRGHGRKRDGAGCGLASHAGKGQGIGSPDGKSLDGPANQGGVQREEEETKKG